MRIGVDVDGVLADFNSAFITRVVAVTGRDLFPAVPFDIPMWNYPEYYGYTREEVSRVWDTITRDERFWLLLPPYKTAENDLHRLSIRDAAGDDIYFITSRPGVRAKRQTEQWLRHYGYQGVPTVLISSEKDLCAAALFLNCYIDDRNENVQLVDRCIGVETFLLNRPWNVGFASIQGTTITRVNSVTEMLDKTVSV